MDHIVETNKSFKGIAWSITYIEDNVLGTAAMVFIECVYSKRLALLPLVGIPSNKSRSPIASARDLAVCDKLERLDRVGRMLRSPRVREHAGAHCKVKVPMATVARTEAALMVEATR